MQVAKGSLFRSRVKLPEQSAKRAPRADAASLGLSYLTLPHPHLICLDHLHPVDQFLISLDGLWSLHPRIGGQEAVSTWAEPGPEALGIQWARTLRLYLETQEGCLRGEDLNGRVGTQRVLTCYPEGCSPHGTKGTAHSETLPCRSPKCRPCASHGLPTWASTPTSRYLLGVCNTCKNVLSLGFWKTVTLHM